MLYAIKCCYLNLCAAFNGCAILVSFGSSLIEISPLKAQLTLTPSQPRRTGRSTAKWGRDEPGGGTGFRCPDDGLPSRSRRLVDGPSRMVASHAKDGSRSSALTVSHPAQRHERRAPESGRACPRGGELGQAGAADVKKRPTRRSRFAAATLEPRLT